MECKNLKPIIKVNLKNCVEFKEFTESFNKLKDLIRHEAIVPLLSLTDDVHEFENQLDFIVFHNMQNILLHLFDGKLSKVFSYLANKFAVIINNEEMSETECLEVYRMMVHNSCKLIENANDDMKKRFADREDILSLLNI